MHLRHFVVFRFPTFTPLFFFVKFLGIISFTIVVSSQLDPPHSVRDALISTTPVSTACALTDISIYGVDSLITRTLPFQNSYYLIDSIFVS